jgi:predicted MPP superfamily phosphohydrolase
MSKVKQRAETLALVSSAGVSGAAAGIAAGNIKGTEVHLMEGVDATISVAPQSGLDLHTMITTAHSESFHVGAGPFDLGINGTLNYFNPPVTNGNSSEHFVSLLSQFDKAVVGQTEAQIYDHLINCGKLGAVVGAALCYGGIKVIRTRRQKKNDNKRDIQHIREKAATGCVDISSETDRLEERLGIAEAPKPVGGRRFKLGMAAAVPLLTLTTALGATKIKIPEVHDGQPNQVGLPACFVEKEPNLQDVTLTGSAGEAIRLILYASCKYPEEVRSFYEKTDENFNQAFDKYKTKRPWWFNDGGNIVRVLHLSDLHCNKANYTHLLRQELKATEPDILINTGDTQTNSGHMPIYENTCIPDFIKEVERAAEANQNHINVITALGNHDAKKVTSLDSRWVTYRTLSSKKSAETVDLGKSGIYENKITFVSSEDPEDVVWSPPPESEKTNAGLLEQSKKIAAVACKIKAETGKAPWILAHREQATSAVIANDCAEVALSGHTHEDGGVKNIIGPKDNIVLQHTAASASGTEIGFTLYEKLQQDASITEFFYDKSKQEIVGYVTPTIHVDESVDILEGKMPTELMPWQDEDRIAPFIEELTK